MKNFEFNWSRIKTNIKSSRQISFLIFCAIILSTFILTWAFSIIYQTFNIKNYLSQVSYNLDEVHAELFYSRNFTDKNTLDSDYVNKAMEYEFNNDYNFSMSTGVNALINGEIFQVSIAGASDNYIDNSIIILDGDMNNIYTENSVAIKQNIQNRLNLDVGDDININGKDFSVAAIIDEYKSYEEIFMSIENYEKLFSNITMGLDLFISGLNDGEINSLTHKLDRIFKNPLLSNIRIKKGNDRYEYVNEYIDIAISNDIIPILLIFILSIISIIVLYFGLIRWRKKNIGIHLSQGATKKQIIVDSSIEIFVYMLLSYIISIVFMNLFYNRISYATSIYLGFDLYLIIFIISIIISIVIGVSSAIKITSKPVSELIGG